LFLNMFRPARVDETRKILVERDHGPTVEGGEFSHHALDDRHEGGVKPGARGAVRFWPSCADSIWSSNPWNSKDVIGCAITYAITDRNRSIDICKSLIITICRVRGSNPRA
jgi:hypothetical protein